ncbi:membrane protein [Alteromonas sp. KUL49]|nr:membrane protein [Alteromonas sp. KUL49]
MHTPVGDPINDSVSTELFFTRYATHFCAPIFIFLAGMSAYLYAHPTNKPHRSPTSFLLKRGIVLIAIEVVLYYLVWIDYIATTVWLQVLWAIGVSMIGLAFACHLPKLAIGALGLVIVFGHNALSPITFVPGEWGYVMWSILHDQNDLGTIFGFKFRASYPVLPWFGVILLGYFAGPIYTKAFDAIARRKLLIVGGFISLFILLTIRWLNFYGETLPWSIQDSAIATVRDFLNFSKYPPSLNYLLITLGFGAFVLAWLDTIKEKNPVFRLLKVYGSVPMFAYIVHLYVLLAAYWIFYGIVGAPHGTRFGLDSVAQIWIGAAMLIALLYYPAKRFSNYKHKEKHNKPWLSYF